MAGEPSLPPDELMIIGVVKNGAIGAAWADAAA
jgi:hypothetical protein